MRAVWFADDSAELHSVGNITRVYELSGVNAGDFSEVNYFQQGTETDYYRPILVPTGDNIALSHRDIESFGEAGTDTFVNGAGLLRPELAPGCAD